MKKAPRTSLTDKVLLAALNLSTGDLNSSFTAEELLVAVWETDKSAFGLRGYETEYPDSNKLYTKIDGKNGLVSKGLLRKVGERTLCISEYGLSRARRLLLDGYSKDASGLDAKLDRALQASISGMISSREFREWLKDNAKPDKFRGAGNFWGIAPGTPPKTVRERLLHVEHTLRSALERLDELGVEQIAEQRGKELLNKHDLGRLLEFHNELKRRFSRELSILDPEGEYGTSE